MPPSPAQSEVWCHRYYLRHLCDEARFPAWPLADHVQLLQVGAALACAMRKHLSCPAAFWMPWGAAVCCIVQSGPLCWLGAALHECYAFM
jgi:hypothetical protein